MNRDDLEGSMAEAFWLPVGLLAIAGLVAFATMRIRRMRARPVVKGLNGEEYRPTLFV